LAVGAAFGLGLCSKYTTIFFAVSILAWVLVIPAQRRWLLTPWPWLGGLVALAVFSPVLIWNAQHQWASIVYQSGRLVIARWTCRY
ncbi:glycosyltransferase family 39 protein, partial [Klebsiella pneumoniae]